MCRAERSTAPLEAVATEIHDLLVHALPRHDGTAPRT